MELTLKSQNIKSLEIIYTFVIINFSCLIYDSQFPTTKITLRNITPDQVIHAWKKI